MQKPTTVNLFSARLRASMAVVGLRPAGLAKRIDASRATVYRWLSGEQLPAIDAATLLNLAATLRVSGRYLLFGESAEGIVMECTPDECACVERLRAVGEGERERLLAKVFRLKRWDSNEPYAERVKCSSRPQQIEDDEDE